MVGNDACGAVRDGGADDFGRCGAEVAVEDVFETPAQGFAGVRGEMGAGDVVAAAWQGPLKEASGDEFCHVIQNDALIERIFEVELPPEEYYELHASDMRKRHPNANPFVLQHLESIVPLMHVAEVTGFSFGASKAVVLETRIKLLGEWIDRQGRSSTEEHTRPSRSGLRSPRSASFGSSWVRSTGSGPTCRPSSPKR